MPLRLPLLSVKILLVQFAAQQLDGSYFMLHVAARSRMLRREAKLVPDSVIEPEQNKEKNGGDETGTNNNEPNYVPTDDSSPGKRFSSTTSSSSSSSFLSTAVAASSYLPIPSTVKILIPSFLQLLSSTSSFATTSVAGTSTPAESTTPTSSTGDASSSSTSTSSLQLAKTGSTTTQTPDSGASDVEKSTAAYINAVGTLEEHYEGEAREAANAHRMQKALTGDLLENASAVKKADAEYHRDLHKAADQARQLTQALSNDQAAFAEATKAYLSENDADAFSDEDFLASTEGWDEEENKNSPSTGGATTTTPPAPAQAPTSSA
ncbi:unnamed protein product [Amoebophrya sp. A120]|nr:unnamed protein product [Amoebophrya sp. A120]|eukprot:GSA120T00013187001.1